MSKEIPVYFASMNAALSVDGLRSFAVLGQYVKACGLDGVDLAPTFDWMRGHTPTALRRAVNADAFVLGSLHAPVRGSGHGQEQGYEPAGLAAKAAKFVLGTPGLGRLVMPTIEDAAGLLDRYQIAAKKRVPYCGFPNPDPLVDLRVMRAVNASMNLFQLKDDAAGTVGAPNPEAFIAEMFGRRAYDGAILDTGHTPNEQPAGRGVVSNMGLFDRYAPFVKGVHFSLNRTDLGGQAARQTHQDAVNVTKGVINGVTGEMLDEVKRSGDVQFVVLEGVLPNVRQVIYGSIGKSATMADEQAYYRDAANLVVARLGGTRVAA